MGLNTFTAAASHANFTDLCEIVRQARDLESTVQCGAQYSPTSNPNPSMNVTLEYCLENAGGWQISALANLSQWIGPLIGFLVPALVFVLCIPRTLRLPRGEDYFNRRTWLLWLIPGFLIVIVEVILWIIGVFCLAAPIMAGSIEEALQDHAILGKAATRIDYSSKTRAVAAVLVGTFEPNGGGLEDEVMTQICDNRNSGSVKRKLSNLLAHQTSFGIQVGAPVAFYLGAYAYALFDAKSKLGDNDTAHAIAFGIWYSVIVLTAGSSCCVLGIRNPHTIESVLRKSPANKPTSVFSVNRSPYEFAWPWDKGRCIRRWTHLGRDEWKLGSRIRKFGACFIAFFLISIPCGLAIGISYTTPVVGFGCRATTILCYACCQVYLLFAWFFFSSRGNDDKAHLRFDRRHLIVKIVYGVGMLCILSSLFFAIGGTIMQLLGVYRNCICKAGLKYGINHNGGVVELATDTQAHRDAGKLWIRIGIAGVCFIGAICVFAWGYHMRMKAKCESVIRRLIY